MSLAEEIRNHFELIVFWIVGVLVLYLISGSNIWILVIGWGILIMALILSVKIQSKWDDHRPEN